MNCVPAGTEDFEALWSSLWQADRVQDPLYSPLNLRYQQEYHCGSTFEDCSLVAAENGRPLLGALMAVQMYPDGRRELAGYGRPLLYLETPGLPDAQRQRAFKYVKEALEDVRQRHPGLRVLYREAAPVLSVLGLSLLEAGAEARPHFTQVIDLGLTEAELHQRVRKSYKSLLNWGRQNLDLRLHTASSITEADMDRFHELHCHVAGRETRPQATWDIQLEMVRGGEAFVVEGHWQDELVSAALFLHSPKGCYYGVSASERELFDKPLSHAVLWTAILHTRSLGCRWFEMGEQLYPGRGGPTPSDKEMNIAKFKRGFGGQTEIRLTLTLEAS